MRSEKGKQDLNVSLLIMLFMNDSQDSVILALKPLSNTCGRGVDPVSAAAAILAVEEDCDDVELDLVSAFAVVEVCLLVVVLAGSSSPICLFFKPSATVASVQSFACATGGGERSTRSGPD